MHLFYENIQPIADRVAQHRDIISKNFRFSTRRARILMGFIIYYLVLVVNPMGRILVHWKSFRNNLEMLCHPICNWLYVSLRDDVNNDFCNFLRTYISFLKKENTEHKCVFSHTHAHAHTHTRKKRE